MTYIQLEIPLVFYVLKLPKPTFCSVPIHSMFGFITRAYKKVGYGSLRVELSREVVVGLNEPRSRFFGPRAMPEGLKPPQPQS